MSLRRFTLGVGLVVAALSACSRQAEQPGERLPQAVLPQAAPNETPSENAQPDDAEPPRGSYEVQRPGPWALEVSVAWTGARGSTHCADKVVVHGRRGGALVWETDEDAFAVGGPIAPLIEEQRFVDPRHVLLLGWSSTGSGMQSYLAIVVEADKATEAQRVVWTGDRAAAARGVAISGTRIGFPMPTSVESALQIGDRLYERAAMSQLERSAEPANVDWYASPFKPVAKAPEDKLIWVDIAIRGSRQ